MADATVLLSVSNKRRQAKFNSGWQFCCRRANLYEVKEVRGTVEPVAPVAEPVVFVVAPVAFVVAFVVDGGMETLNNTSFTVDEGAW